MRGKKVDNDFISSFIENSINDGCVSIDSILTKVNNQINDIDQKIIETENLKKIRSKLLDVKHFIGKSHDVKR